MKMIKFTLAMIAILTAQTSFAQIKFSKYPAKIYKGKHKSVKLNKETRMYRTRFREEISKKPVNFAGHYVLDEIGCGVTCSIPVLYDARSGKTSMLPMTLTWPCTDKAKGFDLSYDWKFKKNSRLFKVTGSLPNGSANSCYTRYFLEKKGKLIQIK